MTTLTINAGEIYNYSALQEEPTGPAHRTGPGGCVYWDNLVNNGSLNLAGGDFLGFQTITGSGVIRPRNGTLWIGAGGITNTVAQILGGEIRQLVLEAGSNAPGYTLTPAGVPGTALGLSNGDLEFWTPAGCVWRTYTTNGTVYGLASGDGDFELWGSNGFLWKSDTAGHPGSQLVISNISPMLRLYDADGSTLLWSAPGS